MVQEKPKGSSFKGRNYSQGLTANQHNQKQQDMIFPKIVKRDGNKSSTEVYSGVDTPNTPITIVEQPRKQLFHDYDFKSDMSKAMANIGASVQQDARKRESGSHNLEYIRMKNIDMASQDKELHLSKSYIPYLPKRMNQNDPQKITEYFSRLKQMEVPLPTSPQPHIDKMSSTGIIKIVKPRESQIKVSKVSKVSEE